MKFARAARENPDLRKALERVVVFKANIHEEAGEKLADEYGAKAIPQFFIMDKDGKALDRWRGYSQPSDWLAQYESALSDPTSIDAKVERYKTKPTEQLAAALGRIRSAESKRKEAVEYYGEAQKLAAMPNSLYATATFFNEFAGNREDLFTLDEVKAAADAVFALEPGDDLHRAFVGSLMADLAKQKKDASLLTPYLGPALESSGRMNDEDGRDAHTDLLVAQALLINKDADRAFAIKRDSLPKGWDGDPEKLNDLAWWCFENEVNLKEGEQLARKGAALAKDDKLKAETLDTAAEICNKLGNCQESVALVTEAAKFDPGNDHYKKQLARFQEALAKKQQS